ncbi:DUF6456 domain-containing protein [Roseibium suaedae]|uniref:DUF6456 domain-containing protein n=1 Tax=Roseibium suaedae TaxID=735517 RepID=A0A1M7C741_9HYPH|nr:DUF6456 domain-containing protein [Roseibium suaedae]SHL62977.1 hypothetical protein SAMN05444272_1084 [Roseibium suaedae]
MKKTKLDASETMKQPDVLRLLKALAAPGAEIRRDSATGEVQLCSPRREPQAVQEPLLRSLLARGLVGEEADAGFSITGEGRLALRRLLSGGSCQDQHREIVQEPRPAPDGEGDIMAGINLTESPLAWLAKRRDRSGKSLLDRAQVEAGERLRADYSFARLMPSLAGGWRVEAPLGQRGAGNAGADMTDDVLAARKRVERVLNSLQPVLAGLLIDVCCHLKGLEAVEAERGWPARSAKVVLQIALDGLADRYGYRITASDRSSRIRAERH